MFLACGDLLFYLFGDHYSQLWLCLFVLACFLMHKDQRSISETSETLTCQTGEHSQGGKRLLGIFAEAACDGKMTLNTMEKVLSFQHVLSSFQQ